MAQRYSYQYLADRKIVRGVFFLSGRRIRERLCSWEEARIVGFDKEKRIPLYRGGQHGPDAEWSIGFQADLHQKRKQELLAREETAASKREVGPSMRELFQEWITAAGEEGKAAGTLKYYVQVSNDYVKTCGNHSAKEIGPRRIDKFTASLRKRNLSTASINIRLRVLNTFLVWVEEREKIVKKPRVRQLLQERRLPRILTEPEMEALFDRVIHLRKTHRNPRQRRFNLLHERFLMVARFTGARLSEIFWLTREQVDLQRRVIAVQIQTRFMVKERREKTLPIPPLLAAYLAGQRAAHPTETHLFDDGAGRLAYRDAYAFTRAFRRHMDALGFTGRGIKPVHGFRAYFADELWNRLGLDLSAIQTWLGHQNISVTARYLADPYAKLGDSAARIGAGESGTKLARLLGDGFN